MTRWFGVALMWAVSCGAPDRTSMILALDPDLVAGATLYGQQCEVCHAADGSGGTGSNIQDVSAEIAVEAMLFPPSLMPNYGQLLEDQQIADVAAYASERL